MPSESKEGYFRILKEHLEKYGRPLAFYVDKHSVFRVNKEELKKGEGITHFGKVLKELKIELICANSPQAKGRVENKNKVYQDRLIKEMRLKGINTIEEANKVLPELLEKINKRFEKEPVDPEDAHRNLKEGQNLEKMFLEKETRKLSKGLTFQHKGILYAVESNTPNRLQHGRVDVFWKEGKEIEVEYQGKALKYKKWSETIYQQPKVLDCKGIEAINWVKRSKNIPSRKHPWR